LSQKTVFWINFYLKELTLAIIALKRSGAVIKALCTVISTAFLFFTTAIIVIV